MNRKAKALRQMFETQKPIRIMGAHNGLGAKLIERAGFDGVWASGLEISTAHALPDANILTMTENLIANQAMNDATSLPVICDCDTGYGNAANVMHMVKKYDAAGLAAAVIEDKHFPKVNSFVPGRQELASISEFCGKLEAAKSAQISEDFMVVGRIEALIAGWGIDEALKRAYAYEEAGADALVIHSKLKTPEEMYEFSKKFTGKIPLIAIPTTYYKVTETELYEHGYSLVIYANHGLRAAIKAQQEVYRSILENGSTAKVEDQIVTMKEVFDIQGMTQMKEDEKKYLKKDTIKVIIPAASSHKSQDISSELNGNPLCMLNIGGKTLIQRQMEILHAVGASDIVVVGGYQISKIEADGAEILENKDYQSTHSAYSIMHAADHFKNRNLILYSDILFDQQVIDQLIDSPFDITIVVDRAYQTLPFREKEFDLVTLTDPAKNETTRRLNLNTMKPVEAIGKKITKTNASCEFIGMTFLNERGTKLLKESWEKAQTEYAGKAFYEAKSVLQASFTDLLQYMIDQKIPVYGLEIEHGWSEVHSADDYKRVCDYFEKNEAVSAG